jgi:hypothetical protein
MTLTVEQIARIRQVADEWVRAGLSTERCNRPRAEASVRSAYRSAGLDEPQHIVWMDSPVGGLFAAAVINITATATPLANHVWSLIGEQPWNVISDQLGSPLAQHLWTETTDQLADPLGGQLRDRLWDPLERRLNDQLSRPLAGELETRLRSQLKNRHQDWLGERLEHHQDPIGCSQLRVTDGIWEELALWRDCAWLASMACALSLAGLPNSPRLDAVCAACRDVDWWWPMKEAVVLTDRPTAISGPAFAYADGYRAVDA